MRIATASGLQINIGRTAPLTRGLRETLNRLADKDLYFVAPAEAFWVETLSNPKKPSIWAGKGPSFDSNGDYWVTPTNFWQVLDNGYMTHYKNDAERAVEMFRDNRVDMTKVFNGQREHDPMRSGDWDDGNRSDGKRGRNDRYKTNRHNRVAIW